MATFVAELSDSRPNGAPVVKIGFSDPGKNDQIVVDAVAALKALEPSLTGGPAVYVNGPASLVAAIAIGHELHHRYAALWVFDPKMAAYVCAVSHTDVTAVGDVEPA